MRATFSIIWYLVSAEWRVRLTKYIGRSSPSVSCTRAALTASSETARYTRIGWSGFGFWMTVRDVRNSLDCLKISSHRSSQANFLPFRSSWTIDLVLSAKWGTNLERAVSRPRSCCAFLTLFGLLMLSMAWHLSGLASIPRWVSMKPRNSPTPHP